MPKGGRRRSATTTRPRLRVFIVDDHALMLEHTARALEGDFMLVGRCTDVPSLMAQWRAARPQVIVLDVSLHDCSGFEVVGRLRADGCMAPVVFMSVHEAPDVIRAAWDAGGIGYVVKRDLHRDLKPAVRAAMRGRRYVSLSIQAS